MKKFIAILMVLGLVGFAVAQDLDCPTSGVAVPEAQEQAAAGSAYDMIISKILEKEAQYIGRSIIEAEWMVWGRNYWGWSSQTLDNYSNGNQSWNQNAGESNAMWNQLSPAEAAAAVEVMRGSHQRVIAAGLN